MIGHSFERTRLAVGVARPAAVFLALALAAPAAAQEARETGGWASTEFSRVRLVAAVEAVGPGEAIRAGFHVRLSEGWHFYWRSAGETGFPPVFDWSGSANVRSVDVAWPAPDRLNLLGFDTYGYSHEVLLPLEITAIKAGEPMVLRLRANYAICSDEVCTYHDETFVVRFPAGAAAPSVHAGLIERFAKRVPTGDTSDLRIVGVSAVGEGEERTIVVRATSAAGFLAPDLIVEGPASIYFGIPKTDLADGGHTARLGLPVTDYGEGVSLAGVRLTLTLIDGLRAVEQTMAVGQR